MFHEYTLPGRTSNAQGNVVLGRRLHSEGCAEIEKVLLTVQMTHLQNWNQLLKGMKPRYVLELLQLLLTEIQSLQTLADEKAWGWHHRDTNAVECIRIRQGQPASFDE
mmetsp:Transcript_62788/g.73050  ORF Transcript_62788/g.73050 Transcript_62788/m.73050 type:complete len:108 (+) Transcript_62788:50-373(+)